MAYNPTTKIITAPVGTPDLQKCFAVRIEANVTIDGRIETVNVLSGDIGVNCALETGDTFIADYIYIDALGTHVIHNVTWTVVSRNEINKWAKYKPVRVNGVHALTDSEFESQEFLDNGILIKTYYGLKISQHITTLSVNLHNTTYEYYKPVGTINSPFRISDFTRYDSPRNKGYYHLANPSINAEMQWQDLNIVYTTDTYPIEVRLDYATDANSINIFDMGVQRPVTSQRFYCCCMLTVNNTTYWRPMFLGTKAETPSQCEIGVINLNSYPLNPVFFTDLPAAVRGLNNKSGQLTIFLMDVNDVTTGGYTTDWNQMSNVEQYELAWTPLTAPGAIGLNVTVKPHFATIIFDTVTLRNTGVEAVVEAIGSFSETPDDKDKYRIACTFDGVSIPVSVAWISRMGVVVGFTATCNTGLQSVSGSHTVHLSATRIEGLVSYTVGTYDDTLTPTS